MLVACQVLRCQLVFHPFHVSGLLPSANQGSVKVTLQRARARSAIVLDHPPSPNPSHMYRSTHVAAGGVPASWFTYLGGGDECQAKAVVRSIWSVSMDRMAALVIQIDSRKLGHGGIEKGWP